jgi:polysaccharide biosynthesis transport protein
MKQSKPPSSTPPNPPPPSKHNEGYGNYGNYGDYGAYGNYGGYGAPGGYGGSGGYGQYGGNSGYYYGYGYGYGGNPGGGEATPTRSVRDYLLILRERIWWLGVTAFVIFTAFVLYATHKTPEYTAFATLEMQRHVADTLTGSSDATAQISSSEDFLTRVEALKSQDIVQRVADAMTDEDRKLLMAPFQSNSPLAQPQSIVQILGGSRRDIAPERLTTDVVVSFKHPNKEIAARVANLYAEQFVAYNEEINATQAAQRVDELRQRAEEEKKKIQDIQGNMTALVDKYGQYALDPRNSTLNNALTAQQSIVIDCQNTLAVDTENLNMMHQYEKEGKDLWDLPFIASNSQVGTLLSQREGLTNDLAGMSVKFGPRHPDMIEKTNNLRELETELKTAVSYAAATVESEAASAQSHYDEANTQLDDLHKQIHDLSSAQTDYNNYLNQMDVENSLYKTMLSGIDQNEEKFMMEAPSYVMVDQANVPQDPSEPKVGLLIGSGLVVGLMAGVGVAFLVAFVDDRIKTAFDIESFVGLPLLGILPRIPHLNAMEKAQAVASNTDRRITEAFRSIYSTLKLNEASKNARAILVTSTVPSEGKSFLTTNLALTYAMHGERVLLIDCDLRMPNIAKSLGKETLDNGLITHLNEGKPFEECIVKDFYPGLDVMPTGGKTRNPTQIFNSREFADFLARMRQQYDRIFLDSPPVGAVSDALNLLPSVDGVLYVIKFNAVKRKVAKINLRRLMEGNVPIFGAILNQISVASASYYYHSYDKSYKNYYVHEDQEDQAASEAAAANPEGGPEQKS